MNRLLQKTMAMLDFLRNSERKSIVSFLKSCLLAVGVAYVTLVHITVHSKSAVWK